MSILLPTPPNTPPNYATGSSFSRTLTDVLFGINDYLAVPDHVLPETGHRAPHTVNLRASASQIASHLQEGMFPNDADFALEIPVFGIRNELDDVADFLSRRFSKRDGDTIAISYGASDFTITFGQYDTNTFDFISAPFQVTLYNASTSRGLFPPSSSRHKDFPLTYFLHGIRRLCYISKTLVFDEFSFAQCARCVKHADIQSEINTRCPLKNILDFFPSVETLVVPNLTSEALFLLCNHVFLLAGDAKEPLPGQALPALNRVQYETGLFGSLEDLQENIKPCLELRGEWVQVQLQVAGKYII
ncbi:hypothetical protein BDN70DRAFT_994688 [Pholiota conissans]|uniref:Uncharacterized protein n=1 Tax=Pholiota conissans TaxID=109636 RepID=A0A9P5YZ13_9AGAR|nr:hypothetical protein BDN70DRAFT_994688 [Pholiota conissans]